MTKKIMALYLTRMDGCQIETEEDLRAAISDVSRLFAEQIELIEDPPPTFNETYWFVHLSIVPRHLHSFGRMLLERHHLLWHSGG